MLREQSLVSQPAISLCKTLDTDYLQIGLASLVFLYQLSPAKNHNIFSVDVSRNEQ
jgi:hypothetical protein